MRDFECIGIPFVEEKITGRRFRELAGLGYPHPRTDGGKTIMWTDASSGAAMIFNTDSKGSIVCVQPAFQAGVDFRGVAAGWGADADGCRFCDPLLATQPVPNSDARPPFVFHVGNAGLARERITAGAPLDLIVAGFARGIRAWKDEAEYHRTPGKQHSDVHTMGFRYDPKDPSPAQYLITGTVLCVERQRNSVTNVEFWVMSLDAPFGDGRRWDVVARDEDLPWGANAGSVVEANVWACAMSMS